MNGILIRSKTARNIEGGDSLLGLDLSDFAVVIMAFLICEACFGLAAASFTGITSYLLMITIKRKNAGGFLNHAARWLVEPDMFPVFTGLDEKGEKLGEQCGQNSGRIAPLRRNQG